MTSQDGFFDAEVDGDEPARYVLERYASSRWARSDEFVILRRFGYRDRHHDQRFVVPVSTDTFTSDLTSVPSVFRWLVPVLGRHLPAALLHDALVESARRRDDPERLDRHNGDLAHFGPQVDRLESDRIFRDAMAALGVRVVRRWLMWTAVVLATAVTDLRPRWRWRLTVVGTLGVIAAIGVVATLNLVNATGIVPWMGDRPIVQQLTYGAAAAVVIPIVLSLSWGRLWPAGMITCVALALLLHITIAIALLTLGYWALESIVGLFRPTPGRGRRPPG